MRRKRRGGLIAAIICILLAAVIAVGAAVFLFMNQEEPESPEELLTRYMSYIGGGNYGQMYAMLDGQSKINISEEDFTTRNKNIYEGIEAQNISIEMLDRDERGDRERGIAG